MVEFSCAATPQSCRRERRLRRIPSCCITDFQSAHCSFQQYFRELGRTVEWNSAIQEIEKARDPIRSPVNRGPCKQPKALVQGPGLCFIQGACTGCDQYRRGQRPRSPGCWPGYCWFSPSSPPDRAFTTPCTSVRIPPREVVRSVCSCMGRLPWRTRWLPLPSSLLLPSACNLAWPFA